MPSTLQTILSYLTGTLGLSPAQAAGVAGNLQVESGLDPSAYNRGEGAIGLAQWEGGRRQALDAFAAAHGTTETDFGTQLAFLGNELHGSESGALSQLLATNDPSSAAAAFDQYYERSSGTARQKRVDAANAIASGKPLAGGSSSSSTSAGGQSVASSMGGLFGWEGAAFTIGVKVLGAAAAAGLVIVGAMHTVSDK